MSESFAGITVPDGEPGALRSAAHAFAGAADSLAATASDLEGMPGMLASWRGPASLIYADSCITNGTAAQNAVWACQIAAQAVLGYADALQDAKLQAREAIHDAKDATRRIKDAEDRIETAQAQIAEATMTLNAAETDILVTGATGTPAPEAIARRDSALATIDGAAADERAARRDLEQARDDLERAKRRGERAEQDAKDAARSAASAVSVAGGLAPAPMPPPAPPAPPKEEEDKPWWQDVGDAIADGASWTADQAVGVGKGFGEGVVGIGEGAYMLYRLSPTNALVNSDDFEKSWGDMGKAAQFAWDHPGEFGKAVANWEDLKEGRYGEWLGNRGPDAVVALATAGSGAAVTRGTRAMKITDDLAESARAFDRAGDAKAVLRPPSKFKDKTVAADGDKTLSGWAEPKPDGYVHVPPEKVREVGENFGHEFQPHFRDNGVPGRYHASHAEKQLIVHNADHPIGVSKRMCDDCKAFFSEMSMDTGKPLIVTDPDGTRVFLPDRTIIAAPSSSDFPTSGFPTKTAIGAGLGSESLSATQR